MIEINIIDYRGYEILSNSRPESISSSVLVNFQLAPSEGCHDNELADLVNGICYNTEYSCLFFFFKVPADILEKEKTLYVPSISQLFKCSELLCLPIHLNK